MRVQALTWSLVVVLASTVGVGSACAQAGMVAVAGVDAATGKQVRAVIEAQLKAFAADDATKAFSYAAPAIRGLFGTPQQFIGMVRTSYPVLLNPTSVVFLKVVRSNDGAADELSQSVQLTDTDGRLWLATYHLLRQADKSWRIGGCELVSNQGRAT